MPMSMAVLITRGLVHHCHDAGCYASYELVEGFKQDTNCVQLHVCSVIPKLVMLKEWGFAVFEPQLSSQHEACVLSLHRCRRPFWQH